MIKGEMVLIQKRTALGEPERDFNELKPEINEFLWRWLPGETTLAQAEIVAVSIFEVIMRTHREKEK